ncbi:MAG: rod shape-determining protein MreD, partial [Candidatus Methylomirabilales bacterium]
MIGVAVLQSALIGSFGWIKPDFFFLLLFFLALGREPEAATGMGFAIGLAQDTLSGAPLGLRAFTLSLVGFLTSSIRLELDTSKPLPKAFLLLTLSLLS